MTLNLESASGQSYFEGSCSSFIHPTPSFQQELGQATPRHEVAKYRGRGKEGLGLTHFKSLCPQLPFFAPVALKTLRSLVYRS